MHIDSGSSYYCPRQPHEKEASYCCVMLTNAEDASLNSYKVALDRLSGKLVTGRLKCIMNAYILATGRLYY